MSSNDNTGQFVKRIQNDVQDDVMRDAKWSQVQRPSDV